ncbi:37S ribosomal protein mrp10, mitochondrial [Grifola frondosa]|uniref:37S ribosomal protein mrp10, mitochondrial n=1 Tax=Grifola frondosa TaxID=5627 RepID=A0A1C7MJR1_GRIFR|nr:37S ribosomal protein mrp10, mitochondrial [Grifola frondosa]
MYIEKLKVRPRKAPIVRPCTVQLTTMLSCWAATAAAGPDKSDIMSTGTCAEAAQALFSCMRTAPMPTKPQRPTINYHLARLGKNLK